MVEEPEQPSLTGYRNLTYSSLTPKVVSHVLLDDPALKDFKALSTPEKNRFTCDSIFCLYLRDVSRKVNEAYYRTILRFVLLYRECMNEYGWIKRRETLNRAKISEDEDEIVR